jgi:hypothetical protein
MPEKLKSKIRKYILNEGDLTKEIEDPHLEFGFLFKHPKGREKGAIHFQTVKPKKDPHIGILCRLNIPPELQEKLNSKTHQEVEGLKDRLKKAFLSKGVSYNLKFREGFFILSKKIYLDGENSVSMNNFYLTLRRLFNSFLLSTLIIKEFFSGEVGFEDEVDEDLGPSFYS